MTARKAPAKVAAPRKAAAAAQEAEAVDGYLTIELRGIPMQVPLTGNIPLAAIKAFRQGDNFGGTAALLGDDQFEALIAAGGTDGDFDQLGEKLQAAAGN